MSAWRELVRDLLLLCTLSLTAGAACLIAHGALIQRRLRSGTPLSECITWRAWALGAAAGLFTLLLLTQAGAVPWHWLGTLVMLVATAPAMLTWIGPPDQHVEDCNLCQIGKGSAYGHYFGYLRLMRGRNKIRTRLENFHRRNTSGLSEEQLQDFYRKAVVALAPMDGKYPSSQFDDLEGVGRRLCEMPSFQRMVGGNPRSYGGFGVYEVTSSDGSRRYVALDKVGALNTLSKLRQHGPARLSVADCTKQMRDLLDELERFVRDDSDLRGQLKVVRYGPDEHVGDAIMAAILDGRD